MTTTDLNIADARALLSDAAAGIDGIAVQLIGLFDSWQAGGAPDSALAWLADLIGQLGWWNGRFTSTAAALSPGD